MYMYTFQYLNHVEGLHDALEWHLPGWERMVSGEILGAVRLTYCPRVSARCVFLSPEVPVRGCTVVTKSPCTDAICGEGSTSGTISSVEKAHVNPPIPRTASSYVKVLKVRLSQSISWWIPGSTRWGIRSWNPKNSREQGVCQPWNRSSCQHLPLLFLLRFGN